MFVQYQQDKALNFIALCTKKAQRDTLHSRQHHAYQQH